MQIATETMAGWALLDKSNARVGARVIYRGEERVIDEVETLGPPGVWLKPATDKEGRDFIDFREVLRFNVILLPDPATGDAPVRVDDLLALGFRGGQGSLLRLHYREFVLDMLPGDGCGYTELEMRGGSQAHRITGRVNSLGELRIILSVLDRASKRT